MSYFPPRQASYLQARDPSIIGWNRIGINLEKVRQNLSFSSETTAQSLIRQNKDEGVRVYLRIKGGGPPSDLYKIEDNVLICAAPQNSQMGRNLRDNGSIVKKYTFTEIFGGDVKQADIFDGIIKEKVLAFINGCNCTLLAYGVSGSGKTFTMMGTVEQPGIIPRSLDYLFRTLAQHINPEPVGKPLPDGKIQVFSAMEKSCEIHKILSILNESQITHEHKVNIRHFREMERRLSVNTVAQIGDFASIIGVWVSFAEIYNEHIYDLLVPIPQRGAPRRNLKLGGSHNSYIKGLSWFYTRTGAEAYGLLQFGLQNLSYAATAINQHSSRSHSIFSVKIVSGCDPKHCSVSVFNFCDLAGSERLKKTHNTGSRLMESTKINNSLSVLGRCIASVRDKQQNKDNNKAPFRESKLTQLFQNALQGKEDILMMVNINPSADMFDDTQHALLFSAIAKEITIITENPVINKESANPETMEGDYEWKEILEENRQLRNDIAQLVLELSEVKQVLELSELNFQEEMAHVRNLYTSMLRTKDERIKKLEEFKERYYEMENERNMIMLRNAFKTAEAKEHDVISISSEENSFDQNFFFNINGSELVGSSDTSLCNDVEQRDQMVNGSLTNLKQGNDLHSFERTVPDETQEERDEKQNTILTSIKRSNSLLSPESSILSEDSERKVDLTGIESP